MAIVTIGVGDAPNDNKGDSIRDAFVKTNSNFAYLDALTKDLVTDSIAVSGNVKLTPSGDEWIYVIDGTGIDKRVALEGTVFTGGDVANQTSFNDVTPSTSKTSGAVQIAGGLGVSKAIYANSINTDTGTVTNFGFNVLSGGSGTFTGAVGTGDLTVSGNLTASGNISGLNVVSSGKVTTTSNVNVGGNVITSSNVWAGNINVTNTIVAANIVTTSNVVVGNVNVGNIATLGNIVANNVTVTTNLKAGWSQVTGNSYSQNVNTGVGTFANATVQDIPSNYHVTNKGYVNTVVVAFAIGLGS